jgi:hypothetical protein
MVPCAALIVLAASSVACARVTGSAVATGGEAPLAATTPVQLSALREPEQGKEVGIVQSRGVGELEEQFAEFVKQVRKVGGNYGKVDSIKTKYEIVYQTQTYSYSCGTSTCYGTRTVPVTVGTMQVLGRAFRVEAAKPVAREENL